jgi:hypothetical protein
MLRKGSDRNQRVERLSTLPVVPQLALVKLCPFAHESQREPAASR